MELNSLVPVVILFAVQLVVASIIRGEQQLSCPKMCLSRAAETTSFELTTDADKFAWMTLGGLIVAQCWVAKDLIAPWIAGPAEQSQRRTGYAVLRRPREQQDAATETMLQPCPASSVANPPHETPDADDGASSYYEALSEGMPIWEALLACFGANPPSCPGKLEACRKLITNHAAILRDVTNPSPMSQLQLERVPRGSARHADEALRELTRRLLGRGATSSIEEVTPEGDAAAQVWACVATYLSARVQSKDDERPGRSPDMSQAAATAFREVLKGLWWQATYPGQLSGSSRASASSEAFVPTGLVPGTA